MNGIVNLSEIQVPAVVWIVLKASEVILAMSEGDDVGAAVSYLPNKELTTHLASADAAGTCGGYV